FPCLFISSYGAEADIVLAAILSAFIYYFTRDFATGKMTASLRLGVLAGLAAATKYSGLVAVVSALILYAVRIVCGPGRLLALRNAVMIIVLCAVVGGWKYVVNYRHYGTALYANGSALEGFSIDRSTHRRGHYEFTTLRLAALMRVFGPRAVRGTLTE